MMPEYERPAAPVAAQWPEGINLKLSTQMVISDWHNYFPDPRLQALISVALENNRDLRIATARIAEARATYGIQKAERFPNVNLVGSRSASLTPASASTTGTAINAQRYDVAVSLVSYELDFWGRVSSLNAYAKASYLASEAAQSAFRLSLIAEVANAYLATLELQQRSSLAAESLYAQEKTRQLLKRRHELGVSSTMEMLQAEGAYQLAQAELSNLQQQLSAAENLLTLLLGQPLAELTSLPAGRELADQGISAEMITGLPAEVLLKRPDVQAAEQTLIAANANIGAARAAFFPRITLVGSAGTASRTLNGLFESGSGAWSFQPSLSVPLFDAGRTAANVDIAAARKVIAVAKYEKTIQQAFREVADLLSASDKLSQQLAAQSAYSKVSDQQLRLVEARLDAGIVSQLDVLDAQRKLYAAEQGETRARLAWLAASTQLYKALAGISNTSSNAQETP